MYLLSPLKERVKNGSFIAVEQSAEGVPFNIADEEFNKLLVSVDGIYPNLARFVNSTRNQLVKDNKYSLDGKSLLEKTLREPLEFFDFNGH
jgi:hypothetical protein